MRTRDMKTNRTPVRYRFSWADSPIGRLRLVASDAGLAAILWESTDPESLSLSLDDESPTHPVLAEATRQLAEYFAGTRKAFDLPLDFAGTDFQQKVWRALLTIPFGETRSYAQIAKQIGHPSAVRAVGAANGRNPIPIIAPCHRVIGSNGDLTGFGGGLPTKEHLLTHEGARTASIGI
jgi:methylated-DNA-[protein]-cysteine S-methyltransferase